MRMPLLACLCGLLSVQVAVADSVRLLGTTRLSKAENDVDVLRFDPCRRDIHALQLRISKGNAEIEGLWVRFANGERAELSVRDRISRGGSTRWIDLPGGERCVLSVGVIGDTERSRRRAKVDIYGR